MSRALAAAVAVAVAAAAATLAAAKPVLSARVLTPDPAPSRFPKSREHQTLGPRNSIPAPLCPTPDSRPANADLLTPDSRALIRRAAVGATRTNAAAGTERTS